MCCGDFGEAGVSGGPESALFYIAWENRCSVRPAAGPSTRTQSATKAVTAATVEKEMRSACLRAMLTTPSVRVKKIEFEICFLFTPKEPSRQAAAQGFLFVWHTQELEVPLDEPACSFLWGRPLPRQEQKISLETLADSCGTLSGKARLCARSRFPKRAQLSKKHWSGQGYACPLPVCSRASHPLLQRYVKQNLLQASENFGNDRFLEQGGVLQGGSSPVGSFGKKPHEGKHTGGKDSRQGVLSQHDTFLFWGHS